MKRISKKTVVILSAVIIFLSATTYAIASIRSTTYQEGLKIKEFFTDTARDQIIAEINGVPITLSQLEFKRYINSANREYYENNLQGTVAQGSDYLNQYPIDKSEILNQIAKERFIIEKAKEAGITISYEEIMKEILEEEEYVKSEAAKGNALMIQRQKEDAELLAALGMTKNEFYEEIYADLLLYSKTFIEYGKYYYTNNPNDRSVTFEEYIDAEFQKADIAVVRYDSVKE